MENLNLQLSRVTEERDKLRNDINEFKRAKSDGAGDEATSHSLLKVIDVLFSVLFLIGEISF